MRLNSLTICGFKSFPSRTRLVFSKGISAIVGPNGCGKSNVVDAIRWVLGEQSPSILRAKAMDNLIFSGADGRAVNFAEVSLNFDSPSHLNIPGLEDASEIEITRRLARSGESEYRINGKACRLKDIQYLFMDTGAGARAYAIIDQGRIGAFVEMDADERRFLLEEAAGVSKYKARKTEAAGRIAHARQNLERLEDLINEVERQRRAVGKQAKKTEQYLALRNTQEALEKAVLAYEWKENSTRLHILSRTHEKLTAGLSALNARISDIGLGEEAKKLELMDMERDMDALSKVIEGAEEKAKELK
ncbi:MAG: AAA family ATPase, partial [Desulfobacteraceae bacterium]|nr:AAA family ATPase [Desulfobacteraceae bacterium]